MKFVKACIVVIMAALLFVLGYWSGESQCEICPPSGMDFSLFWETYYDIQELFVGKDSIDEKKILYGAISGMVESLDDPYTIFMNPEETMEFMEEVTGKFEGVGMEIGIREDQLTVISPMEGTPAQKAGLLPGDKIVKIGDVFSQEITIDEAVKMIKGEKGTVVSLTIFREGWNDTRVFEIERDVIEVETLKVETLEGNISYIKLYQFSEKAESEFVKAVSDILKSPADRIILDLRGNPGGYLEVAQKIAGWFIEKGETVTIEDFGDGRENNIYQSLGPSSLASYPLVVLIDQGSASGAEILAGALRDIRGITLIGETSFGKGSVQLVQDLSGYSTLKVTIAHWLTPSGLLISEKGLNPDVEVKMSEEDYLSGNDPQLSKAIEIIRDM
jgi:carboxyl-terminal processing protease